MPRRRGTRGHGDDRHVAPPSERSAGVEVAPRAQRHVAEVGLRHDEHVGDLHDPGLEELQDVAGAGLDDDGDGVGHLGDLGLGLADADGLDDDDVEGGGQRLGGRARRGRQAAEPLARRRRADEDAVGRRGRTSIRARSPSSEPPERLDDGSTASTATLRPRARHARTSADSSVDLPAPGGPVTPTTCAGASPPSAAGETSRSSAASSSRAAGVRVSTRFRTAGRGAAVALAQAAAELGARPRLTPRRATRARSPRARRCRA